jgi:hypothetical protein
MVSKYVRKPFGTVKTLTFPSTKAALKGGEHSILLAPGSERKVLIAR